MTQLRSLFSSWDLDKDGYLDKDELAKAFRGPNARAYDYKAPAKNDDTNGDRKDRLVTGTRVVGLMGSTQGCGPLLSATAVLAPKPDKDETALDNPKKSPKQPDYSRYPDYQFLTQLDTDGDGKVSKSEFETWARGYAAQLKQVNDQAKRVARAEARLSGKLNATQRQKVEGELRHEQEELRKLNDQQRSFERQLARTGGLLPK
jgi:hypothetical protein